MKHSLSNDQCINDNHFLWIHIQHFGIDVGAIYRKPDKTIKPFLETYSHQLNQRKRAVVFGDFNINLLVSETATCMYKDILKENNYEIANKINEKYCTRETSTTQTIIDHICHNLKNNNTHFAVIKTPMSDHNQVYFEIKRHQPKTRQKISYEAINYEKLYKSMEEDTTNNAEHLFCLLEERLFKNIKKSKIVKYKIQNPPRQDWINKTLLEYINNRNTHWNAYKQNQEDKVKHQNFIETRNKATIAIQSAKSEYYKKKFDSCKDKPAKMWSLINSLSHNKIKEKSTPAKLQIDDNIFCKEEEICECFNDYFSNIGMALANKIDKCTLTRSAELCEAGSTVHTLDNFSPTTTDEISKIINNLNNNTSAGIDGINSKCIKCVKKHIIDELTQCVNNCLKSGVFPDSLKIAKVSPIYKAGSKSDPGNYRPISVLPVLSKVFERVIYTRLEQHLTSQNFIYEKQYGFRPKSNTLFSDN